MKKNIFSGFGKMIKDAIAFVFDKDARVLSTHRYESGRYMSVREAKKKGLVIT